MSFFDSISHAIKNSTVSAVEAFNQGRRQADLECSRKAAASLRYIESRAREGAEVLEARVARLEGFGAGTSPAPIEGI